MSFDEVNLKVSSGSGGRGCLSFASSRRKIRGGPDGGDGGQGGAVILKVDTYRTSLSHLNQNKTYKAGSGLPGQSRKKKGKKGEDLIILVPPQTWLELDKKQVLLKEDKPYVLVDGGLGGKGNTFFKNSINQSPEKIGQGLKGKVVSIHLEMRMQAEIALMGLSPIGPCSFLSNLIQGAFSAKKSYFYEYLFTKDAPWIGLMEGGHTVIEIPFLLKNANLFLKHTLTSKLFIYVVDFKNQKQCMKDVKRINHLLNEYDSSLSKRHFLVYFTSQLLEKIDHSLNKDELMKEHIKSFTDINLLKNAVKKYVQ